MRELTPTELQDLRWVASRPRVEVGLFEVTDTQLKKGIVDATDAIRSTFRTTGFHDYLAQGLGQSEHGVLVPVRLVARSGTAETKLSLYRPKTKKGDPRLWIHGLTRISPETRDGDVVALIQDGVECVALNLSRLDQSRERAASALRTAFSAGTEPSTSSASELLGLLQEIVRRGPIPALRRGDTAVGHAIESALGIRANSSKSPDFKGIEIKSSRTSAPSKPVTLFAQVPDWGASPISGSLELMNKYGYPAEDCPRALRCTVSAAYVNPQGLQLDVDLGDELLQEFYRRRGVEELAVIWRLETLYERFAEKHNETFWIDATQIKTPDGPAFVLNRILHTDKPNLTALGIGLADGAVTLDHTIKTTPNGTARDHGYLFRVKRANLLRLLSVAGEYELGA